VPCVQGGTLWLDVERQHDDRFHSGDLEHVHYQKCLQLSFTVPVFATGVHLIDVENYKTVASHPVTLDSTSKFAWDVPSC